MTFKIKTTFKESVQVMLDLEKQGHKIKNALYLDMGSVSEGYAYDLDRKKHLLGNGSTNMQKYTNLLLCTKAR